MTQFKVVPVEATDEMLASTSWPNCAKTDYAHMLAAAPEFEGVVLTREEASGIQWLLREFCPTCPDVEAAIKLLS